MIEWVLKSPNHKYYYPLIRDITHLGTSNV